MLAGGGLDVPLNEAQRMFDKVNEDADAIVTKMGLRSLDHPDERYRQDDSYPCLPANLMDLSDRDLGELHTRFETWQGYAGPQIAELEGGVAVAKDRMDHIEASIRESLSGSDDKRRRKARLDRRYLDAKMEWRTLKTALTRASAIYKTFAGGEKVVSRNITLRLQQAQTFNRGASIQSARRSVQRSADRRGDQQTQRRQRRASTARRRPPVRPGRRKPDDE